MATWYDAAGMRGHPDVPAQPFDAIATEEYKVR